MCRHLAYLGEPVTLAELLLELPHSLVVQSYAPTDMRGGGKVNADGFGAGWFGADGRPRQYRRAVPIWQDGGFAGLARDLRTTGLLAAVRNATAGMPIADAACAPFTDGRWLFSLNGYLAGWPDTAAGLAAEVPHPDLLTIEVMTDATLLWALLRRRLATGSDPAAVLGGLIAEVLAVAPGSRLTTLLTDGQRIYATTVTHSLNVRRTADGVLLASEPLDEAPGWQPIPDGRLVVADRGAVHHRPLPDAPPPSTAPVHDRNENGYVHQRR